MPRGDRHKETKQDLKVLSQLGPEMPSEQAYRGDRHKETKQDLKVLSQLGLEMPTEQA
jgi:hypothetical protein